MPSNESLWRDLMDIGRSDVAALYQEATLLVEANLRRVAQDQPPDLSVCRPLAERLVAAMREVPVDFMMLAFRPKSDPSFLAAHPVNVAIILLELSQGQAADRSDPVDLALLGLLHDIGLATVQDIIQLPRRLTAEERVAMERHVAVTHELLVRTTRLSPDVIEAATQDHERLNGSGYPSHRRRSELHWLGTLLAVADIFEAMTHDRPHQAGRAPYVVLRELLTTGADVLEAEFLKLLVFRLGVYPVGSWVELSTREVARVVGTRPETPLRPLVEVVSGADHHLLAERRLVDLSTVSGMTIRRWLDEATLRRLITKPTQSIDGP